MSHYTKSTLIKEELRRPRYVAGAIVTLLTVVTTYFIYTNPNLNMAALFHSQQTGGETAVLYVPSYDAGIGESGQLEVRAKNNLEAFDAMSFFIEFDPTDALSISENSLILDNQTLVQSASFKDVTLEEPGLLGVTLLLDEPVAVDGPTPLEIETHETLFKIQVELSDALEDDTPINLSFKELTVTNNEALVVTPDLPSSTLTALNEPEANVVLQSKVNSIFPESITNEQKQTVLVSGSDLDTVDELRVGDVLVPVVEQFSTSLKIEIPAGFKPGVHDITLVDDQNNDAVFKSLLTVVGEGGQNEGEAEEILLETSGSVPVIDVERSYTNPAMVINDGQTPFTFYTFVQDVDQDIESVLVDVSAVGQVGPEAAEVFESEAVLTLETATCPTSSNTIACMTPSITEGNGQWYLLSNLSIRSDVVVQSDPYLIEVLVKDAGGNSSQMSVPLYVGNEVDFSAPRPLAVVATGPDAVEILFNKAVDPTTISSAAFSITSQQGALGVQSATINAAETIVTLKTGAHTLNEIYQIQVSSAVQDKQARPVATSESTLEFTGFQPLGQSPVLDYLSVVDNTMVELEFQHALQLSSIFDAEVMVYESEDPLKTLNVLGVAVISDHQIQIMTDTQSPNRRYRLKINGLKSYDGTELLTPLNRGFKGYNLQAIHQAASSRLADFNNDLRVDFADFTIFSSVYGTTYDALSPGTSSGSQISNPSNSNGNEDEGQIGQPIQEDPDALVPITEEINA